MKTTTLLIVSFGFVALIAFVFAYIQRAEAKRQATLAIECELKSAELINQLEAKNRAAVAAVKRAEEIWLKAESESKK